MTCIKGITVTYENHTFVAEKYGGNEPVIKTSCTREFAEKVFEANYSAFRFDKTVPLGIQNQFWKQYDLIENSRK